ncbi:hypothetical protein GGR21_000335 [Dysgonomonas hofstadii]|uniref:Peptidyl-prolyl cis-trans isomerase n=1 Tax=Dysgonomonas hofstadii TaxID=637886 RepID=A0A840CES3_9BACT|nr:peptidylprolyl isomerase [Dysgonomonas hofstadii]MBB4034450.1 hypothetical protein [Dysgonomonas hofstadii]
MKYPLVLLISALLSSIIFSCKKGTETSVDENSPALVSVKNKTLYKADVEKIIPIGFTGEDSIMAAQSYMDMWIHDQLMYDKAEQNIVNKNDIESLVEDYKKSLIVNSYQEQLLKEHFSREVSGAQLKAYYEENKEKFKLEENIIKGLYLKIPSNSKELNNFIKWYKQGTDAAVENIEKNRLQNAASYEYFYDQWVSFDAIMENIPSIIDNKEQYLRVNKNIEVRDSLFVYLLNIKEFKLAGDQAPFEYIKGVLSEIYLEQRKADYLKQVRKDLYEKAVSDKEIKFYNK